MIQWIYPFGRWNVPAGVNLPQVKNHGPSPMGNLNCYYAEPFKSRVCHFFCKGLQRYDSPADWARKLFKQSMDSESLLVEIKKTLFRFGFGVLCGWPHNGGLFLRFWLLYLALFWHRYTHTRIFSDNGTHTPGMTLPRRAWVRINHLRTGVGRFRSCLYKCGMASSKTATSKKFRGDQSHFW